MNDTFAWAFFTKKMNYTTELVYDHKKATHQMNNAGVLEPRLQKLDKVSEEILRQHRERESHGILPPLTMKYDAI